MTESSGERAMLLLGVLPLAGAALWLTVLHEPNPVAARAAESSPLQTRDERTAGSETRFVGVVVAGQDAELGAELAGEVLHVFVEPGSRVKRGDALLQLASASAVGAKRMASAQSAEDRSALEAARLTLENARDKAQRMASADNAFPVREINSARADAARAAAELARLRGSAGMHHVTLQRELFRAEKQLVRAPFDGVLAARFVDLGDFVGAGQALARVVDDGRFVRFAVPGADQARLAVGASVRVEPTACMPLTAAIVDIDPELDPAAQLGFARAQLSLNDALLPLLPPGTRVDVVLPTQVRGL